MGKLFAAIFFILMISAPASAQTLTTVILPQYIQGVSGTNANRIPYAYRVKITGLTAGTTYRFYNQIVVSTDGSTTSGAGNCLFISASGDFVRTSNPSLKNFGNYGIFTADAAGAYEGWFASEPTGNARFAPGKYVFMRIALADSSTPGTIMRVTTSDSVRVLKLNAAASDSTGTGLRCTSTGTPKDFVFAYDNVSGSGRPLSGTFIESDGTANTTASSYANFYASSVDSIDGAFGMVLPNMLPSGVRRIEQRTLRTGNIVSFATDTDGMWPSGVNSVNPIGGTAALIFSSTDVHLTTDVRHIAAMPGAFGLAQNFPNPFNPATTISFTVPTEGVVTIDVFNILGIRVSALLHEHRAPGTYQVSFDAAHLPGGVFFYRMTSGSFTAVRKMILTK
jgi:hypothetical protein